MHVSLISLAVFLLAIPFAATAQTACDRYVSGEAAPTGFGVAWNPLTTAKELLLSSYCNSDGSVQYTVGSGGQLQCPTRDARAAWPSSSETPLVGS